MSTVRACSALIALAVLGLASLAHAQDPPANGAAASKALFDEGRALMLEGRFDEACPKIAESQRLDPHLGTLLNLAACHEKQGKVASAWVEYQKALTAARTEGQTERERLARERIEALDVRVPWLTLSVRLGEGQLPATVTLDGAAIAPIAWGKELPVDPGAHVVVLGGDKRKPLEENFELREGERRTVVLAIGAPESAPEETLIVDGTPKHGAPPAETAPPREQSRWVLQGGLVLGYVDIDARTVPAYKAPQIQSASGQTSSCYYCSYTPDGTGGALAGVHLFGGYALSDGMHLGVRFLGGPRVSRGGGNLITGGPTLSVHMGGAFWGSASFLVGTADIGNGVSVIAPADSRLISGTSLRIDRSIDASAGGAVELAMKVVDTPRGGLFLSVMPLFLIGAKGNAWALPIGVDYRFR